MNFVFLTDNMHVRIQKFSRGGVRGIIMFAVEGAGSVVYFR